jgi:hypothetical protein
MPWNASLDIEGGEFILLFNFFGMVANGLVHERKGVLSPADLFLLMEYFCVDSNLFVLAGNVKLMTGNSGNLFFAVEFFDAVEAFLMVLVVAFDAIQLHYSHGSLIFIY